MRGTYLNLSVPLLLPTLFAPWRRIVTYPGAAVTDKLRAMVDNAVSRCVGFTVRLITLLTALVLLTLYALVGGLTLLIWPLLPVLSVMLVVLGLVG